MSRISGRASLAYVVIALAARLATESTANASYLLLAAYALFGRGPAIQAIALSWLFSMLSPGIATEAPGASIERYAVLVAAAASVLARSKVFQDGMKVRRGTMITVLLGLFFIVHALLFSPIVDVSVLKSVSWTLAMATLIAAWLGLREEERSALADNIYIGLVVLMIVSLPLLALPVGYLVNKTGFQGVLNHPQAFGSAMALLGAWAASRMLGKRQPPWSAVALVGACLALVLLSEARTAGFALVLGVGSAAVLAPSVSGRSVRAVLPGLRSKRVYLVGGAVLVGVVLAGPRLESVVTGFISKSGRAGVNSPLAAYERSRSQVTGDMWANIRDKPIQGIGFGIPSDPTAMDIKRDPVFGLPTGASIEKGVMPLAVLEEVGIIGFAAVAAWVLFLLRRSSTGGISPFAVLLTALFLNMGESTLFSAGGMGLLSLVLIGWAFACGQNTERTR
jgi:hypothetical protein